MLNEIAVAYYVIIAASSIILAKETGGRVHTLIASWKGIRFAPITITILMGYAFFAYPYLDAIPILNWGWLGYNITMGPFGDQGFLGIAPFVPILIYMLLHLNYYEELYFRRNKKLVMLWAFLHIAMGVPLHVVIALLPAGFIYKYIYDKYGINNAFAAHFATNIFLVSSMLVSYAM
jgi:hypothetical protein